MLTVFQKQSYMRRKIVAGNWKLNTTLNEGVDLAGSIIELVKKGVPENVSVIIAPPFTHLSGIKKIIGEEIGLSAQNCAAQKSGAFTGEVSAEMIKSAGAEYVIIGHSERRNYFNESDMDVSSKVRNAIESGLRPLFCCGEKLHERERSIYTEVIKKQIQLGLFDLSTEEFGNVIIAYEPVWAIGTGKNATPEQAQEIHQYIRHLVEERYDRKVADNLTILYGGSCKPSNAGELFANNDVDGGLIGGASLSADDFYSIINSF